MCHIGISIGLQRRRKEVSMTPGRIGSCAQAPTRTKEPASNGRSLRGIKNGIKERHLSSPAETSVKGRAYSVYGETRHADQAETRKAVAGGERRPVRQLSPIPFSVLPSLRLPAARPQPPESITSQLLNSQFSRSFPYTLPPANMFSLRTAQPVQVRDLAIDPTCSPSFSLPTPRLPRLPTDTSIPVSVPQRCGCFIASSFFHSSQMYVTPDGCPSAGQSNLLAALATVQSDIFKPTKYGGKYTVTLIPGIVIPPISAV